MSPDDDQSGRFAKVTAANGGKERYPYRRIEDEADGMLFNSTHVELGSRGRFLWSGRIFRMLTSGVVQ